MGLNLEKKLDELQRENATLIAERNQLALHLGAILQAYGNGAGFAPSLSVFERAIHEAKGYMAARKARRRGE